MADIQRPIDILVQELRNNNEIWREIRCKLKITGEQLNSEQLKKEGGHKPACTTFKLTRGSESWVVKFSPKDKQDDPWYDVYKEYETLETLASIYGKNSFGPKPLHRCSEAERGMVGTKFIITSFVEGKSYENAKAIPEMKRSKAFSSVLNILGKVHRCRLTYCCIYSSSPSESSTIYRKYTDSQCFWHDEVSTGKRNYDTATADGPESRNGEVDNFFEELTKTQPLPSLSTTRMIHGDMNISNVIFDNEYNVRAFVNWKMLNNGDPMVDVAYLCLTFMTPGDYGEQFKALDDHPLLLQLGHGGNILKTRVPAEYLKFAASGYKFDEKAFNYATAVCCLRWLSILKAAKRNGFKGHKSGGQEHHTKRTQDVMTCLAEAGKSFLKKSQPSEPQDSCTIT